jgi:hypothetical protein
VITTTTSWSAGTWRSSAYRWAALELLRQGVRHALGGFAKDSRPRPTLHCDRGPQYIGDAWISEVKWLDITISPSYVGELECKR